MGAAGAGTSAHRARMAAATSCMYVHLHLHVRLAPACRYRLQLFYGRDRMKELSYAAHLAAVAKAFAACSIQSYHKTHASRGSGAREARQKGCVGWRGFAISTSKCLCCPDN